MTTSMFETVGRVTGRRDGYESSISLFLAGLLDFSPPRNFHFGYRIHPASYVFTGHRLHSIRNKAAEFTSTLHFNSTVYARITFFNLLAPDFFF